MKLPEVGPQVPRRGNPLSRLLGRAILALFGWRIEGDVPDLSKAVVIVAPHTSNWDFVFGIATILALGLDVHWLGKHTLFRGAAGPIMRYLGGIPIDRQAPKGVIFHLAAVIEGAESFVLALTPEGTRRRVEKWKSGFYRIAEKAGVPIVLCYFDYADRVAGFGAAVVPTGDLEKDLREIRAFYRPMRAKRPERFKADLD